tara:strand:- start:2642 stop:3289 length:648 start_codon:yes stop_codon:yes gene_type:complete
MRKLHKNIYKIISINVNKKKRGSVILNLGDGSSFTISNDICYSNKLFSGKKVSKIDLANILDEDEVYRIKQTALRLISYRKRSKKELKDRLKVQKYSMPNIAIVIKELEQKRYLDDKKFSETFILSRIKNKKLGPIALINDLKTHGISFEDVEKFMDKAYKQYPAKKLILEIVSKRTRSTKRLTTEDRRRLINHLKQKGFYWSDIQEVSSGLGWL